MIKTDKKIIVGFTHFDPQFSLFWTIFQYYLEGNAARLNIQLIDRRATSIDEQIASIGELLDQQIDILLIKPIQSGHAALIAQLARCSDKNVPVIALDASPGGDTTAATIRSDQFQGQAAIAKHIFDRLNGAGKVAYLRGDLRLESGALRAAGFDSMLAQYPGIELVYQSTLDWSLADFRQQHASAMVREALARYPDLKAIIAASDDAALGAIAVLAEAGLQDSILVAGFDAIPEALVAIEDGKMEASARQNLDLLAHEALQTGLNVLNGNQTISELVKVDLIDRSNVEATSLKTIRIMPDLLRDLMCRAEEQAKSAKFLEAVIDNIPVLLFVKEAKNLTYVRTNKAREQWLGVEFKNQIGKNIYDFYPREIAEVLEKSDRDVFVARTLVDIAEERTVNTQGPRILNTKKIPLYDKNGEPEFLVGISIDITEQKQAEKALAQRNADLEAAHAALQENQMKLLIAEKMASLGRLTAGIAHEMNTPLAAVRAAINELRALIAESEEALEDPEITTADRREIFAEMKQSIQIAEKSAERAAGFVRGVKAQTRDFSGQQGMRFNAVAIIKEALLLLSHALLHGKCALEFSTASDEIELQGAPGRLSQVINNLIVNAIHACAKREGSVIKVSLVTAADYLALTVKDNGSGMPPEIVAKMFDPMFTTKPFGEGTGLGLTIVHEIITSDFRGNIEVDSKPGLGTTFSIRMPVFKSTPPPAQTA